MIHDSDTTEEPMGSLRSKERGETRGSERQKQCSAAEAITSLSIVVARPETYIEAVP